MKICFVYHKQNKRKELLKVTKKVLLMTSSIIIVNSILPDVSFANGVNEGVSKADSIGYQVWQIIKTASKWIMAAFAAKDILQSLNEGSGREVLRIVIKYAGAYAAIIFILKIFLWIERLGG